MTVTGGCQCGAVRYTIEAGKLVVYACHCTECRKQSASAFGLSVPVRKNSFQLRGPLASYTRPTQSGARTFCWFCPTCGARIYHQSDRTSDYLTVKGGSLDDIAGMKLVAHIWVSRKLPWVLLDSGGPAHSTQPRELDAWRTSLLTAN